MNKGIKKIQKLLLKEAQNKARKRQMDGWNKQIKYLEEIELKKKK